MPMIAYLRGPYTFKSPTDVIIEAGGVGYRIHISLHTYSQIQNQPEGKLFTYFHVKEDSQSLYGFLSENSRFSKICDDLSLNTCFSIVQLNIRSSPKNLSNFENYLSGLNHCFTVIGISETWLNDTNKHCYSVNGYNQIDQCRDNRPGGGVSLYVKDSLSFKCRSEFNRNESHIECIFIELSKSETGLSKDTVIGMIYRSPNQDIYKFNESLGDILQVIKQENKLLYLMGDFNINLLDLERHLPSSE